MGKIFSMCFPLSIGEKTGRDETLDINTVSGDLIEMKSFRKSMLCYVPDSKDLKKTESEQNIYQDNKEFYSNRTRIEEFSNYVYHICKYNKCLSELNSKFSYESSEINSEEGEWVVTESEPSKDLTA